MKEPLPKLERFFHLMHTKLGRDSRFFAANEANLSIFDGDSLK
ncbi:30S ribosomal protein S17 [Gardnerella vaginalis]|uniref:Uncharacterized protein n=1 Tax=Gardnerella vaginalis (strain ATCC 14019 / 317) TaxID=525284 RepID=E3D834_GARV3|nr:hypothetical protein HMPREF0421_20183 [Gardnerella vaginalis ATCC 14019]AYZ21308.1 30S ribosomal protein S17 [Gardnerella vaginalis]TCH82898.1 30S ribosomal protein S17 [Gardnerella vaginalis ATCC 14018 = JCM 11026]PKY97385.1 30S ribosomal protein S17 [Gardnerella vaginalis]PKZ45485.1 30S ribosomal protein S17 [Gardnerella vaginalis]